MKNELIPNIPPPPPPPPAEHPPPPNTSPATSEPALNQIREPSEVESIGGIKVQLYFGLCSDHRSNISEDELQDFVDKSVSPLFPNLSISRLDGRWVSKKDGTIVREPSMCVEVLSKDTEEVHRSYRTIADTFKLAFLQDSVMIVVTRLIAQKSLPKSDNEAEPAADKTQLKCARSGPPWEVCQQHLQYPWLFLRGLLANSAHDKLQERLLIFNVVSGRRACSTSSVHLFHPAFDVELGRQSAGTDNALMERHHRTTDVQYDMEKNNLTHRRRSNIESVPEQQQQQQQHLRGPMSPSGPAFPSEAITNDGFLGRLGGAQRFALPAGATPAPGTAADALQDPPWSTILSPSDFRKARLWKLAFIEAFGTAVQVYLSGVLGVAILPTVTETSVGAVFPVTLASIVQIFTISLFIYATGPVTGAHFNPLITMGTFMARLSSLPRTLLYISHQCIGAVVGAYLVRASLGLGPSGLHVVPGCYIDSSIVTPAEAFTFESVMCFVQLFLAFGLGLDPRNETAFGPQLAPILIGLSSALVLFTSSFARPGYLGASLNPARCLGLMAAGERFTYHWVHWVGPLMASTFNGLLYWMVPPYKKGSD